jgi:hypothetical protein
MDSNQKIQIYGDELLCRYYVIAEQQRTQNCCCYETYGLLLETKAGSKWELTDLLHDVTPDFSNAKQMAELFTKQQLSGIHFRAVVEGMLLLK